MTSSGRSGSSGSSGSSGRGSGGSDSSRSSGGSRGGGRGGIKTMIRLETENGGTTKPPMCFADVSAGECCTNRDCDSDKTCDTGFCVDIPSTTLECERDGDCRSDETCFRNQCVPFLPPATTGRVTVVGDPATTARVTVVGDPCELCKSNQVCNNGVCERPSKSSSSSSRSSGGGRTSSGRESSGSSGSSGRGSGSSDSSRSSGGSRGGGRGGIKTVESLAFDGGLETETKSGISLDFKSFDALKSVTVNVSTLLMFALVAITVWFGVWCFRKVDGQKKEEKHDGESFYGAV